MMAIVATFDKAGDYAWQCQLLAGSAVLKTVPGGAFTIGPDTTDDVTWRAPQAGGAAAVAPV